MVLIALLALAASACSSTATVTIWADGESAAAPVDDLSNVVAESGDASGSDASDSDASDSDASETGATDGSALDDAVGRSDADRASNDDADAQDSGPQRSATSNVAFAATPSFLAYAADQVEASSSYRFEMFQEFDGGLLSMGSETTPLMTGVISGDTAQMGMDLGSMFGGLPMPGIDANADMAMNIIVDGETMYLNAPFFASIMQMDPNASLGMPWLDTVASGWGSIDVARLGGDDAVGTLGESFGMGTADASALLDMLESAGDVLDGGTSEVRGVPTNVVYASVSLTDLVAAGGSSMADLDLPTDALDGMPPISIEVHIDDANLVRRMEYRMDLSSMMSAEESMRGMDMGMWQRIDFFAFGEVADIAIPVGAPDITDEFAELAELGG